MIQAEPTLRLYDRDRLPAVPVEPYGIVDASTTGRRWDPSLTTGTPSGRTAFIVTGVGDRRAAALWVLDVVRRVVENIDPADVDLTGTTRLLCMWSAGAPSPPDETGDLVNVTETYHAHVEAL